MPLSHTVLLVSDFPASFGFYRDYLGFQLVSGDQNGPIAVFSSGQSMLGLFDRTRRPSAFRESGPESPPGSPRFVLALLVDDIDNLIEKLRSEDVPIQLEPTDFPEYGYRSALCADPDGNPIEIYRPLLS